MKLTFKKLIDECIVRAVVRVNGAYHLFEEQVTLPIFWTINKRTSSDGFNFSAPSEPLFKTLDSYDKRGQADPSVLYDGSWKMWFDCLKSHTPDRWESIAYATSQDGEKWEKKGEVLHIGQGWESAFIHHPCVMKFNNRYFMYYAGSNRLDYQNMQIGLATSIDGISWQKHKSNPVLRTSADEWDCVNVRPSVPVRVGNIWYMFYWGFDGGSRSIGLAYSKDLFVWRKKRKLIGEVSSLGITNPTAASVIYENSKFRIWFANYVGNYGHVSHSSLWYCTLEL